MNEKRKRVDSDWKQRAAEEKRKIEESLAEEQRQAEAKAARRSGAGKPTAPPARDEDPIAHDPARGDAAGRQAGTAEAPAGAAPRSAAPEFAGDELAGNDVDDDIEGIAGPPRVDFMSLIQPLAAQAMSGLGQLPDPRTGMRGFDLEFARDSIDLLAILEHKTRGNLSADEAALMQELLTSLRSGFASAAQALAAQAMQPPPATE